MARKGERLAWCPRQVDVAGGSGPQVLEFGVQSIRDFRMRAE